MAKYSKKVMGKEVGSADVYAEPHTMKGKKLSDKGLIPTMSGAQAVANLRISIGDLTKDVAPKKNPETKIRGTGAATKGTIARGPMA